MCSPGERGIVGIRSGRMLNRRLRMDSKEGFMGRVGSGGSKVEDRVDKGDKEDREDMISRRSG